jgi:hypothetical protein
VKEFMMFAKVDCTPFMMVAKVLLVVASVLLFMILVLAIEPPRLEVRVLPVLLRVLEVFRLVTVRFVPVAFVKRRFEIVEVMKEEMVEKRLVEVALVEVKLLKIGLSDNIYVTLPSVVVATVRLEEDARY